VKKPVLLFVSPRFLFPADSGGKIRTTKILHGLKGGRFSILLACPATDEQRGYFADDLHAVADEVLFWPSPQSHPLINQIRRTLALFSSLPLSVAMDFDRVAASTIKSALDLSPEVVVFDFVHSTILAPPVIEIPSVLFTHNIEAEIFRRHYKVTKNPVIREIWRRQYRKMLDFEREALSRFDRVVAVSERDGAFFRSEYGVPTVEAISTGVDLDYFAHHFPSDTPEIVFIGSMDWLANIDGIEFFLNEVWGQVVRLVPNARMKVIGRNPPGRLVSQSSRLNWHFSGYVDDIRPHVAGAAACIIPLRVGGGTRIKVYEAMAMGVPVVSTRLGVEGLPVVDGEHYLAADTPENIAQALASLLLNPEMRIRISRNARDFVEANSSFRRSAAEFEAICRRACGIAIRESRILMTDRNA
jgi:polysaccharide biosynthesis protein PslH